MKEDNLAVDFGVLKALVAISCFVCRAFQRDSTSFRSGPEH